MRTLPTCLTSGRLVLWLAGGTPARKCIQHEDSVAEFSQPVCSHASSSGSRSGNPEFLSFVNEGSTLVG